MMTEISAMNSQKIFTKNGFDMHYEIHGSGAPLLLLHGFTGSSAGLASLFNPFLDTHQLIIPDLRGHGRSTNPSKQFTFTQAASDVFSLLEHLHIDTCSAVGFSGGGCTLLHMATQKPDSIRSMALVSATTHFPEKTRELMRQFTVETRTADDWKSMRQKHHYGDDQIKMLWEQANAAGRSRSTLSNRNISRDVPGYSQFRFIDYSKWWTCSYY
jgi:pimeloyl-ACP methyl ester carboxylesterase